MSIHHKNLSFAVGIALGGALEIKQVKFTVWKHEFNVKGIRIEDLEDGGIRLVGTKGHHLSHHRSFKKDQQIYYSCEITKSGEVQKISVNYDSPTEALQDWFEAFDIRASIKLITQDGFKYEIGFLSIGPLIEPAPHSDLLLDGGWLGDVECLIANIIVYAAVMKMPEIGDVSTHKMPAGLENRLAFNPSLIANYQKQMTSEMPDLDPDNVSDLREVKKKILITKMRDH